MSEMSCPNCGELFQDGDKVVAEVLSTWKNLKSTRVYAINTPYDCNWVEHQNCAFPKGDPDEPNV
jgi:hypothetical protein